MPLGAILLTARCPELPTTIWCKAEVGGNCGSRRITGILDHMGHITGDMDRIAIIIMDPPMDLTDQATTTGPIMIIIPAPWRGFSSRRADATAAAAVAATAEEEGAGPGFEPCDGFAAVQCSGSPCKPLTAHEDAGLFPTGCLGDGAIDMAGARERTGRVGRAPRAAVALS